MNNLLWNNEKARAQHNAVRTTAGWYYFTHHLVEVKGPDACALLDYLYTADIASCAVGRMKYTMMLDEEGIAQDDCIIFRIEDALYWVSTLHRPRTLAALEKHKGVRDVEFRSITEEWDYYSVQGPRALDLVNAVVDTPVDDLKFFQIADNTLAGLPVKVARSGYAGEACGYEVYSASSEHEKVAEALRDAQDGVGAVEVDQLDVMAYTLATEAGLVLVTDIDREYPFECGMERYINYDKDFLGKDALLKAKERGATKELLGITVDQKDARLHGGPFGAPVFKDGAQVGRVTKYTFGFTLDKGVGFILVDAGTVALGDEVILNHDTVAKVCELPPLKR